MKVFITGISSGLGLHLAGHFLRSGDQVRGIARRPFDMNAVETTHQGQFAYYQCDTTQPEQVAETYRELYRDGDLPDVVIFCAGSASDDVDEKSISLDAFKANFEVNVFGIVSWIETFLPHFLQRNKGTFAAVSSMSVFKETRNHRVGYSASRCALNKAFENLRIAYSATDMAFIIFNMGRMQMNTDFIGISYPEAAKRIRKIIISGRRPKIVNIPYTQYILTRMIQIVPDKVFQRFFLKP